MNFSEEVLGRLAAVLDIEKDGNLADVLGAAQNTLSTWKKRNKVPFDQLLRVCIAEGISLDYILTGKGEPYPHADAAVGGRLQAIREDEGEGLSAAAAKMGIDIDTLQAWEAGEQPICLDNALRFVVFNGYSVDWLLTGKGEMRTISPASSGGGVKVQEIYLPALNKAAMQAAQEFSLQQPEPLTPEQIGELADRLYSAALITLVGDEDLLAKVNLDVMRSLVPLIALKLGIEAQRPSLMSQIEADVQMAIAAEEAERGHKFEPKYRAQMAKTLAHRLRVAAAREILSEVEVEMDSQAGDRVSS